MEGPRCFWCEFDPEPPKPKVRIPRIFARRFIDVFPDLITLRDPVDNVIEVSVLKYKHRLYLTQGWYTLRSLYNLDVGGWVKGYYMGGDEVHIQVFDNLMIEAKYPRPSRRFNLPEPTVESNVNNFHHSLVKYLTQDDVDDTRLLLPEGFCHVALSEKPQKGVICDEKNNIWPIRMKWCKVSPSNCKIKDGWPDLVRANDLLTGQVIRLGVSNDNQGFIHLRREREGQ